MSKRLASTAIAASLLLAGCVSVSPVRDRAEIDELTRARGLPEPAASPAATPDATADLGSAIAHALAHSPELAGQYAHLGLAEAEVLEAGRIANPTFGYSILDSHGSEPHRAITQSFAFDFASILLRPGRTRLAHAELERTKREIAGHALALAAEVEHDWYGALAAQQVAEVRELAAEAAQVSADLAARFHEAGNITRLQLVREQAQAAESRVESAQAQAEAEVARATLLRRIGAGVAQAGKPLGAKLRLPPKQLPALADLQALARDHRLDVEAARAAVRAADATLAHRRRWRWLGDFGLGVEREHDSDGTRLTGPTAELTLPLVSQGQADVLRAGAEGAKARAELAALELDRDQAVQLAHARMRNAQATATDYREQLIPAREAVVEQIQQRVNYMLMGAFELLEAKREAAGAYEHFLLAVRDYWQARAELRGALGTRLPDDGAPSDEIDLIGGGDADEAGHSGHHHHDPAPEDEQAPDTHEHDHGAQP